MAHIVTSPMLYLDPDQPIETRVGDLLERMTLEEKIAQMLFDAPAIERLNVAKYNWWNEGLHGLGRAGLATVFPQAIGLAATWNPDLLYQIATAISDEARAKHHKAARKGIREIYTGLTIWSPNINIFRDPRWGRGQETYGEDPYLTAALGVAFVKGLQGDDPHYLKVVATAKHYAAHSGPESIRHEFDARVNQRDLWETYLPAFRACVQAGQVAAVMGAYNRTNGEPCCASPTLLEQILRQQWGFDGHVVSDCWAIIDIYAHHKVVKTPAEAAALAVKNGCDLNCGSTYPALNKAVEKGLISEDVIDLAVKRLFKARFQLGMFDPPEQVPYAQIPPDVIGSVAHRRLSLNAAQQSMVLLKNEDNLLPLAKDIGSIAVVGPNADSLPVLLGNYNGTPQTAVTPLEGIRNKVSDTTKIYYSRGCGLADGVPALQVIPTDYLRPLDGSTRQHGLTATYFNNPTFAGNPTTTNIEPVVDFIWKDTTPISGQWGDHFAIRWHGFLVPPVSGTYKLGANGFSAYNLYLDGDPVVEYKDIHHPILKTKDVTLEAGRFHEIRLDYVSEGLDPQVQLLWSRPDIEDEAPLPETIRQADVVVAVMGLSPHLEGEEMPIQVPGFAGGDRTDIKLPRPQEALLRKLQPLGKPVVLVLLNGSALAINWAADNIPAIVEAWYPGQAGGEALADILFGDYNPAGRLPVTYYKSVDDLPPFEDYGMEGRTYRYFRGEPLYPFGHGLSYTTFQYSNLRLGSNQIAPDETLNIQADITNSGQVSGDEVVQLYVKDLQGSVPRSIQDLKGFKRIALKPGETKTIAFDLSISQLGFYDRAMNFVVEPGPIEVMLGASSADIRLTKQVDITGETSVVTDKVSFS
jgi:beta-glucosidase